jgi:hypothetical protein
VKKVLVNESCKVELTLGHWWQQGYCYYYRGALLEAFKGFIYQGICDNKNFSTIINNHLVFVPTCIFSTRVQCIYFAILRARMYDHVI